MPDDLKVVVVCANRGTTRGAKPRRVGGYVQSR